MQNVVSCTYIRKCRSNHRIHIGVEEKWGECICSLSWSVHHNFACDGRYSKRGRACTHHPHQAVLILPSRWNVRQKVVIATLCVYSVVQTEAEFLDVIGTKVLRVSLHAIHSHLYLSESGLKLVCNVNIVYGTSCLRTLKSMPRNLNEIVRS